MARNTLANANAVRDWRMYADFAQALTARARALYANEPFAVELDQTVYAQDSTTIDLCLSLFPWAPFRKRKGAVHRHTLLDVRTEIPTVVIVTSGRVHDVKILDRLTIEAGAIYLIDRPYLDCARLYRIQQSQAFFITRARSSNDLRRLYSRRVDKSTGLRCDQTVDELVLMAGGSAGSRPGSLRGAGVLSVGEPSRSPREAVTRRCPRSASRGRRACDNAWAA